MKTWRKHAACVGNPEPFFKVGKKEAARICAGCPVTDDCFDYALNELDQPRERIGVWGGRYYSRRNNRWVIIQNLNDRRQHRDIPLGYVRTESDHHPDQ